MAIRSPSLDETLLKATLTAGQLELRGGGEPGATLQDVIDGAVAASTVVDQNGQWSVALQVNAPGIYAMGLQSVDDAVSYTHLDVYKRQQRNWAMAIWLDSAARSVAKWR